MQIFENAEFISCEDQNRVFRMMVEDRGRIVFTGDHLPEMYQSVPTRIDLHGQCILPAFADTHMHFESFAFFRSTLDVRHVKNFDQLSDSNHGQADLPCQIRRPRRRGQYGPAQKIAPFHHDSGRL
jgi:predicted amidohydrolase YtcJ